MLKNYLKTAWRNLLKNKFYSIINIVGLTVGLAIGILILLWVQNELSFDSFHKKTPNIYRMAIFGGTGASRQIWRQDVAPMGPLAKQQLTGVKDQVRITGNEFFSMFRYQDKVFGNENVVFADPSFFSIFDFPLVQGNTAKPFANDNSVVITKKTAKKYFGNENPIGKVIVADDKANFTVSGVINDFPDNSSFNMGLIMPMSYHTNKLLAEGEKDVNNDFSNFGYETYVLLNPGIAPESLKTKLFNIHISHKKEDTDVEYLLLPLTKMHLYHLDGSDGGISTVRIFIVIALLILVIACINYVNLSTARSMLRSKEISMRKIIGAAKSHLFLQFIVETALLFLIAAGLAILLIYALMPAFNELSGKQLVFNLNDYHIWIVILATISGTLIVSSIYPALLLSSFEPLKALKGKVSAGMGDVTFRKILVVTQFTFSVILIIGTIVITGQLNYIRSKQLGYDKSHVLAFWMRDMAKHYDAVKAELLKQPGVLGVTRSNSNIVSLGGLSGDTDWDGKAANQTFIVHPMAIDKDFMSFFKMKLVQGAGFTGAVADSIHFILNEAAVKEIGLKNPIGKRFRMRKISGTIIGVVKDFHFASMREKISPAIFYYTQDLNSIYIKTDGRNAQKAINAAQDQFKQYNGQYPFDYTFLDDIFNNLYKGEQREGTLFNYFAGIAIMISCLGLLGLAAFTAQVRTREIGVRKVLGASVSEIIGLLAKDFIKLVLIAIAIAIPAAWFTMNKWLEDFAYRISIGWYVFVLAGLMAILIAFITISFQSVKAALANPVKSLRSE
ncbi:putative ABC transport system permease protein [Mucilaginibacter lappiensis]|uniref:ABC transport system permease protein n=1 Tax=Mucilaginibacter lappiensis TaxID=354630 RepID=A0ABR6PGN7_9SPHI|nr:ABC transporter permease [Mucilaginibacter lappiensis]MBB6108831.1 putative ABC transport system permease protein [Mucilaginibacter lappiensis]SIQ64025.1 putative ABC transport system permease protein [Mucilaginibacter lappiensis]